MPTISVIVPVYNVEKYLHRCIDSILAQTFTDFELILVDDGSADGSGAICDEYAAKDSRVRVIHKENGGVSASRNTGMDAATGDYILFCDSDDYVSRYWAEQLALHIKDNPESFISCRVQRFKKPLPDIKREEMIDAEAHEITYYELFREGLSAYSWNKIYVAKRLRDLGLRFSESVEISEDVEFNTRYCAACKKVLLLDCKLYFYRQLDSSATGRYRPDILTLHFLPFQCRLALIDEANLREYCSIWFHQFYHMLDNVFDQRNTGMKFWEKVCYNQKALSSDAFQYSLGHADLSGENPLFVWLMKNKCYYLLLLAQKAAKLKHKLRGAIS